MLVIFIVNLPCSSAILTRAINNARWKGRLLKWLTRQQKSLSLLSATTHSPMMTHAPSYLISILQWRSITKSIIPNRFSRLLTNLLVWHPVNIASDWLKLHINWDFSRDYHSNLDHRQIHYGIITSDIEYMNLQHVAFTCVGVSSLATRLCDWMILTIAGPDYSELLGVGAGV